MKKICKLTNDKYISYNFVTSYEMLKDLHKKTFEIYEFNNSQNKY